MVARVPAVTAPFTQKKNSFFFNAFWYLSPKQESFKLPKLFEENIQKFRVLIELLQLSMISISVGAAQQPNRGLLMSFFLLTFSALSMTRLCT